MNQKSMNDIALKLDQAEQNQSEVIRFTKEFTELSVSEGYLIQKDLISYKLKRGETITGYKMGLTSRAKMEQMGVKEPIMGVLTDEMLIANGDSLEFTKRIHPKVEPEIAFITSKALSGRPTREQALEACESVCATFEIIDSRYFNFDFKLSDVVADNCSSAKYVLGPQVAINAVTDLENIKLSLYLNETLSQTGLSSAILGHPVDSLCELVAMLHSRGLNLPKGSHVLAGAATAAVSVEPGDQAKLTAGSLGEVTLQIRG